MKKLGLLLCASATMILAACSAGASQLKSLPERDKRIIVEVDRDLGTLNEDGVKNSQRAVYNNIKATATSNVRFLESFDTLNNAFVLEVNSNDIESIRSVPGVKSVTTFISKNNVGIVIDDSFPVDLVNGNAFNARN